MPNRPACSAIHPPPPSLIQLAHRPQEDQHAPGTPRTEDQYRVSEGFRELRLETLDAANRDQALGYLLEQLQVYQQQLRELELQQQWRQHAGGGGTGGGGMGGSGAGGAVSLPPIGPGGRCCAQASALPPEYAAMQGRGLGDRADASLWGGASQQGPDGGSLGLQAADAPDGSLIAVNGPVRPWGKRAQDLPPSKHSATNFQKAKRGVGGSVPHLP